jgi:hypothetical protein
MLNLSGTPDISELSVDSCAKAGTPVGLHLLGKMSKFLINVNLDKDVSYMFGFFNG